MQTFSTLTGRGQDGAGTIFRRLTSPLGIAGEGIRFLHPHIALNNPSLVTTQESTDEICEIRIILTAATEWQLHPPAST